MSSFLLLLTSLVLIIFASPLLAAEDHWETQNLPTEMSPSENFSFNLISQGADLLLQMNTTTTLPPNTFLVVRLNGAVHYTFLSTYSSSASLEAQIYSGSPLGERLFPNIVPFVPSILLNASLNSENGTVLLSGSVTIVDAPPIGERFIFSIVVTSSFLSMGLNSMASTFVCVFNACTCYFVITCNPHIAPFQAGVVFTSYANHSSSSLPQLFSCPLSNFLHVAGQVPAGDAFEVSVERVLYETTSTIPGPHGTLITCRREKLTFDQTSSLHHRSTLMR